MKKVYAVADVVPELSRGWLTPGKEYEVLSEDKAAQMEAEKELAAEREKVRVLREACSGLVAEWMASFEGQETGYEDTELHDCVKDARAALEATKEPS